PLWRNNGGSEVTFYDNARSKSDWGLVTGGRLVGCFPGDCSLTLAGSCDETRSCRRGTTKKVGGVHLLAVPCKRLGQTVPAKVFNGLENGHIEPKSSEGAKQQGVVPGAEEGFRE